MSSTDNSDLPDMREIVVCSEASRIVHRGISALLDLDGLSPSYPPVGTPSERDLAAQKIREFGYAFVYGFASKGRGSERLLLEMIFTDHHTHAKIEVPEKCLEELIDGLETLRDEHAHLQVLHLLAMGWYHD